MKVLFCTPEVYPYSKIGGLADFSASLPKSLSVLNNDISIVSPLYKTVKDTFDSKLEYIGEKNIIFGSENEVAKFYKIEENNLIFYFIGHEFFDRKNFFNHSDDIKRFIFFDMAILELLSIVNFYPDIMHLNDWSTSLIPYFLSSQYASNPNYEKIKTLLTIHNLEKQGSFNKNYESLFTKRNFTYMHLDNINFLKAGIMRASKINTVSKSYRSEILTKFFGFSLDGALKARQYELLGIQNGLDYNLYNPETDKYIYKNYSIYNFKEGKKANKDALLKEVGFKDSNKMIVSFVSRFAREKGITLILNTINQFLDNDDFYLFVIGEGDLQYDDFFNNLALKYPNNVCYNRGHNHEMSQKIYAASDLLLMPSLYEASGLNQMIAMRYGTIPLVRETGGLKDTVEKIKIEEATGTGFTFENFDRIEFSNTLASAVDMFYHKNDVWQKIIKNAMLVDNDNFNMAKEYNELYKKIVTED